MSYYVLNVCCATNEPLKALYAAQIEKKMLAVPLAPNLLCDSAWDAGFDLYSPLGSFEIAGGGFLKADLQITCSMEFFHDAGVHYNVGYFLYPRSSLGLSPLRLSNSVGVIDAGYRGPITALLDNTSSAAYTLEPYQRLVQIVCPNITYPMYVRLVSSLDDVVTERGVQGLGSSGL
jgi:dUTPase